jgi:hypothetical protein
MDLSPGDGRATVRYESAASDGSIMKRTYTFNTTFSSPSQTYKPVFMSFTTVAPCVSKIADYQMSVAVKVTPEAQNSIRSAAMSAKAPLITASSPARAK